MFLPRDYSFFNRFKLFKSFLQVNMTGLTGHIEFDSMGFRTNFHLDIVELDQPGFVKVGSWDFPNGANYTRTFQEVKNQAVEGLKNKTLIVTFAFVSAR